MEEQNELELGIGTKEPEKLKAEDVVVRDVKIVEVPKFGKKVVLVCQHPQREESLEISKAKIVKNNKIESSGIWFNLDEDGKILKNSTLALCMDFYKVGTLKEFSAKVVHTDMDDSGYLVLKAY